MFTNTKPQCTNAITTFFVTKLVSNDNFFNFIYFTIIIIGSSSFVSGRSTVEGCGFIFSSKLSLVL